RGAPLRGEIVVVSGVFQQDGRIGMIVEVDEARRGDQSLAFEDRLRRPLPLPDAEDRIAADREIADKTVAAGAVVEGRPADQDIGFVDRECPRAQEERQEQPHVYPPTPTARGPSTPWGISSSCGTRSS